MSQYLHLFTVLIISMTSLNICVLVRATNSIFDQINYFIAIEVIKFNGNRIYIHTEKFSTVL